MSQKSESVETCSKALLVYPTMAPSVPLEKNILNNFILDMRDKHLHKLTLQSALTDSDLLDLQVILQSLMPDQLIGASRKRNLDCEVYKTCILGNNNYFYIDEQISHEITKIFKEKPTPILFEVDNECTSYAHTILRAVVSDNITAHEGHILMTNLVKDCLIY